MTIIEKLKYTRSINPFYYNAFSDDLFEEWHDTPFANEILEMSYLRAHTSFIRNTQAGERMRRDLLYCYLLSSFSSEAIDDTINRRYSVLPSNNIYITRALNNITTLYNLPPIRTIENDSKEALSNILQGSNLDSALDKAYKIARLTNQAAIRLIIQNNKLKFLVLLPDMYNVIYDYDGNISQFWQIYYSKDKDSAGRPKIYHMVIDKQSIYILDGQNKKTTFNYNGLDIQEFNHNLGFVPVAILNMTDQEDAFGEYGGAGMFELIKAQLDCNEIDLCIYDNIVNTGYTMWMAINMGLNKNPIKFGAGRIIPIDNVSEDSGLLPPSLEAISPDTKYNELEELKTVRIATALKGLGLPISMIENNPSLVASGIAMKIDRLELEEIRQSDINILRRFEQNLINMTAKYIKKDTLLSANISDKDYEITIDYDEGSKFIEPKEELEYYDSLYNKNLITVYDYVKLFSGKDFITDDASAIEYIKNNIEAKKQIGVTDAENSESADSGAEPTANVDGGQQVAEQPISDTAGAENERTT